jgi:hypothetical protein
MSSHVTRPPSTTFSSYPAAVRIWDRHSERPVLARVPGRPVCSLRPAAARPEAGLLCPTARLLCRHRLRGDRADLARQRDVLGGQRAASARPPCSEGAEDSARGRTQAAAVDGQPRRAGAPATQEPDRAGVHATAGGGDGAAHPRHGHRVARRGRHITPVRLVAALTFPLPATMIFSFIGVPKEDWSTLKEWCGHRTGLAWGRPTPDQQVVTRAEPFAPGL